VLTATAGASGTAVASTTAAATGGSAVAMVAKITVVALVVAGLGAGGYVAVSDRPVVKSPPAPVVVRTAATAAAPAPTAQAPRGDASVVPTSAPLASQALPPVPPVVSSPVARDFAAPESKALSRAAKPRPVVAVPPPDPTFEAETHALRDALGDLRDGMPGRALAAIDAQDVRFPKGALREERAEARIVALCALGRVEEARAKASLFLQEHPRSLLAGRVRASCGGTPAP
jgi:hypothetical protein